MTTVEQRIVGINAKEPQMARLVRVWDDLRPEQREDLVYLAQSMANRNRRERRNNHKTLVHAA